MKLKLYEEFKNTQESICLEYVETEKEMILVDTKNVNDIISTIRSGKMPLDKLRVMKPPNT